MLRLDMGVLNIKKKGSKLTLGQIAIILETGTDIIPPRPAFQNGLNLSLKKHKKLIEATIKNIAIQNLRGDKQKIKLILNQCLTQIGRSAKKETQDIIKNGTTAPNAPSTIAQKGFDHPLFHHGDLLENVTYQVSKE